MPYVTEMQFYITCSDEIITDTKITVHVFKLPLQPMVITALVYFCLLLRPSIIPKNTSVELNAGVMAARIGMRGCFVSVENARH